MKTQTSPLSIALSLLAGLAMLIPVYAHAGKIELSDGMVLTAKVVAINKENRSVKLQGPEGNELTVQLGSGARNFDQIEIDDKVTVEYDVAVGLSLGNPKDKPEATAGMALARAAKGEKPGGVAVTSVNASARVDDIDKEKRSITLELADGSKATMEIDESVQEFDALKKGDLIQVSYTETIAITVENP